MKTKCKCKDCGKSFEKGTEGDNEKLCLRCDRKRDHARSSDRDTDMPEYSDSHYPTQLRHES